MQTVAIVGGGFSGTMAAVNLARLATRPLEIVLINSRYPLGRGVAYGTSRGEHILNVAARNMSAVPDRPGHFVDWLKTRSDYAELPDAQIGNMFVQRRVYGDYLRGLLQSYLAPIDEHHPARIRVIEDEVVDLVVDGTTADLALRGGDVISAHRVLLATGNQPPAPPAGARAVADHPAWCGDPWGDWSSRLPDPAAGIVILGTGLTMVDACLTLFDKEWQGQITAVSRNGLIPNAHFRGIDYPDILPPDDRHVDLSAMVQLLEDHCERIRRLGENPGILIDRLRPHTQRYWQHFTTAERKEFLSRYAARWNVIRHRIAQPVHQQLTEAVIEGRLRILKGTISNLHAAGDQLTVDLRSGDGQQLSVTAGMVVNCTGPNAGFSETDVPLFRKLLERNLISPDDVDLGIRVASNFAVIDADGETSSMLFAMGPLMKGTLWETTAVPELRGQAMRVAEIILEDAAAAVAPEYDYRLSVTEEHVIEYYI
jgi:uncharacterized NAD(P)/FAD-binding protein YdhS